MIGQAPKFRVLSGGGFELKAKYIPAVKPVHDDRAVLIHKDVLFAWHSAMKAVIMFPGIEAKIGKFHHQEVAKAVLGIEAALGVVKGDQGFNG